MAKKNKNLASKDVRSKTPTLNSMFKNPWFFFYPEHFGLNPADPDVKDKMNDRLTRIVNYIISLGIGLDVHAIVHYKDYVSGSDSDPLVPSVEKPHAHIAFRPDKNMPRQRLKYYFDIFNQFGIAYRPNIDNHLITSGNAISNCNFERVVVYHTHETEDAISDGKTLYDRSEAITTLTAEEIEELHYKYKNAITKPAKRSQRNDLLQDYINRATVAAHALKQTFEEWFISNIPPVDQSCSEKLCRRAWDLAEQEAIDALPSFWPRCSIFIHSIKGGLGKSATSANALKALDMNPLIIGGGAKSGKTDKYNPFRHKAIIFNDTAVPAPLDTFDTIVQDFYKRNRGNKPNLTSYIVCTSNLPVNRYFEKYDSYDDIQIDAIITRLFVCKVDEYGHLILQHSPTRFKGEAEKIVWDMFNAFADAYNSDRDKYLDTIENYKPISVVDTPEIVSKPCKTIPLRSFDLPDKGTKVRRNVFGGLLSYQYMINGNLFTVPEADCPPEIFVYYAIQDFDSFLDPNVFKWIYSIIEPDIPNLTQTKIVQVYRERYDIYNSCVRSKFEDEFAAFMISKKDVKRYG